MPAETVRIADNTETVVLSRNEAIVRLASNTETVVIGAVGEQVLSVDATGDDAEKATL